ncbi:MAG: dihydrodipicolinate synthase family protein [Pseudomonadota bacterium]
MTPFYGVSAFPVTPADDDGRVDTDHLQRLVSRLAKSGVASIGVLGSTGSYMYLSSDERASALAAAVEAAGDVPVIAGVGAMRESWVIEHAKAAEGAGAAGLLLAAVNYLPLLDDEVVQLAADLSSATDLPICIYNNPGTTHFNVSEALVARLAKIPNVMAVKNPIPADGDYAAQIKRLRGKVLTDFSLGYSGDAKIADAIAANCDAFYSVLAGTFPDICLALWAARGDATRLATLNNQLAPLWALFNAHGSIRIIHEAAEIIGLGPTPLPRPLLPLPVETRRELEIAIDAIQPTSNVAA